MKPSHLIAISLGLLATTAPAQLRKGTELRFRRTVETRVDRFFGAPVPTATKTIHELVLRVVERQRDRVIAELEIERIHGHIAVPVVGMSDFDSRKPVQWEEDMTTLCKTAGQVCRLVFGNDGALLDANGLAAPMSKTIGDVLQPGVAAADADTAFRRVWSALFPGLSQRVRKRAPLLGAVVTGRKVRGLDGVVSLEKKTDKTVSFRFSGELLPESCVRDEQSRCNGRIVLSKKDGLPIELEQIVETRGQVKENIGDDPQVVDKRIVVKVKLARVPADTRASR